MAKRPTKRERRQHLVLDSRTAEMVCQNCGDRHKFPEPSPFEVVMAEISEFCQRHENCKPVAAEQG